MSGGCALRILGSKCDGQGHNTLITEKGKISHSCFLFTPVIMKLRTKNPHESRMCHMDFDVKRSKIKVTMHWLLKMFNVALLLSLYTYHHETSYKTPNELRICPIDFEVKRSFALSLHHSIWNVTQRIPLRRGYVLLIFGSKGRGYNALIIGNFLCRIITFTLHLSSLKLMQRLAMSQRCALLILGSRSYIDSTWVEDVPYRFRNPKVKVTVHWLPKMTYVAYFICLRSQKVKVTMHWLMKTIYVA